MSVSWVIPPGLHSLHLCDSNIIALILFYLGYHILFWGIGGQKCPTLVFSKLEMVWQWNLAHIEAILCQVKANCAFSKWRIIFDDISTKLRNTVKFTIFWYILLTGVVQSSPNTYFQKRWFLLTNTTWKWQKVKNYWKKRKKKFRGFFSMWCHPRKGVVGSFPNSYFQQCF